MLHNLDEWLSLMAGVDSGQTLLDMWLHQYRFASEQSGLPLLVLLQMYFPVFFILELVSLEVHAGEAWECRKTALLFPISWIIENVLTVSFPCPQQMLKCFTSSMLLLHASHAAIKISMK